MLDHKRGELIDVGKPEDQPPHLSHSALNEKWEVRKNQLQMHIVAGPTCLLSRYLDFSKTKALGIFTILMPFLVFSILAIPALADPARDQLKKRVTHRFAMKPVARTLTKTVIN